ncbi:MAG: hypothetical protein Kow00120_21160 [Anaerolineae bacterium]
MSTNATTWFYTEPERDPYLIEERVNHTLWDARMPFLYFDCVRAEPPFRMVGAWQGAEMEIEWEVGKVFTLRVSNGLSEKDLSNLRRGFSLVLGIHPPSLAYQDADGVQVTEWHTDGGERRWQQIQGQARFGNPKRHPK